MEIEIRGLEDIKRYLEAMPDEAGSVLRTSVNRALAAAHREALIQISRRYTISMQGVEKELREIRAKGGSIAAKLESRGRPRGLLNFNVHPKKETPAPAWTSKRGYATEILSGQFEDISRDYFWIALKGGSVHLARRAEPSKRDKKNLRIFKTVSTPQMLGNKDVAEKVTEVTKATLEEIFARSMERRLTRR
ncbi:MAG: hypothetical protein Q4D58_07875 [Synergistaceae bacterium]|nr:hypothetical protein [Synergistaceae bacterium]